jgi:hypothetical protein
MLGLGGGWGKDRLGCRRTGRGNLAKNPKKIHLDRHALGARIALAVKSHFPNFR